MRFIAFGCSHTRGDGILPGDTWQTAPSRASWVQVLSDKFNIPLLNLACSGGSNLLILHAIRNHEWQQGDIALIQWTYFSRSTIFNNSTEFDHISSYHINNRDRAYIKQYYTLFPDYHTEYLSLQHIEHAYLYMAAHNISKISRFAYNFKSESVNSISDGTDITVSLTGFDNQLIADFQKPTMIDTYKILKKRLGHPQLGADNMHFNAAVHREFADEFASEISVLLTKTSILL